MPKCRGRPPASRRQTGPPVTSSYNDPPSDDASAEGFIPMEQSSTSSTTSQPESPWLAADLVVDNDCIGSPESRHETGQIDVHDLPLAVSEWTRSSNESQSARDTDRTSDAAYIDTDSQHPVLESYLNGSVLLPNPLQPGQSSAFPDFSWNEVDQGRLLPRTFFIPYVRLFLERLYPIFPVLDGESLLGLLQEPELQDQPLSVGLYAFLTALSAAVIVQLNGVDVESTTTPMSSLGGASTNARENAGQPTFTAHFFVSQCLEARREQDFIEEAGEWTILTSFFLFAYYGNMDQCRSAWYYLREAIGFSQSLELDEPNSYCLWDAKTQQRRRRLFWLLFITERFVVSTWACIAGLC